MIERFLARFRVGEYFSSRYVPSWSVLALDTVVSVGASFFALLVLRALLPSPMLTAPRAVALLAASALFSLVSFGVFRTFRSVIRHSTLRGVWKLVAAVLLKDSLLYLFVSLLLGDGILPPKTAAAGFLLDGLLTLFLLLAVRLTMLVLYDLVQRRADGGGNALRTLVYGTGDKEIALAVRLQHSPHYRIAGFLTYGRQLKRYTIAERPVCYFENRASIAYLVGKRGIDAVLFSSPAAARDERERLVKYCTEAGVRVLVAPPIDEVTDGRLMKQVVREIRIEDLLGRPEICISLDEIREGVRGRTILVTGAAGSIGSELCRQLAGFGVGRLVLFDNAETPMHNIRLELEERHPGLTFTPVIGDVRMPERLNHAFATYRPQIVFHAAAYKHVPLMEENPCEAVLANVAGTRNVADLCLRYGVEKMVMISTDKAVNPTNVMGASKRMAEIYVQSLGQAIRRGRVGGCTQFVTTRFGNVLGSNGSVIPRFREQIERGGPVTVTHPAITRFFMTIPEACRLVMEAATISSGNEIFVFDMGESVRIADLARRMIELAGFRPGEEIQIAYTGLRPGEKLYEEVLSTRENTKPTTHEKIRVACVREYDYFEARAAVEELERLARRVDVAATVRLLKLTIPEYKSRNSAFEEFDRTPVAAQ